MSHDRKIILHAGLPKTGTSTIQHVLYENRDFLLQREGVLYPSLEVSLTTPLRTMFHHDSLRPVANKLAGLTPEEEVARREHYRRSLDAEISSNEWKTLLLSAEGVYNMSELELSKLREWGEEYSSDWTILMCVRHPLGYVRSVIPQATKSGGTLRQLYKNPPLPKFRKQISRAISVFGRERVRVFDFDAAAKGDGGVVGAFVDEVRLGTMTRELLVSRAERKNESLSLEAVCLLDSLNRQRPMFLDGVRDMRRSGHELAYLNRIKGRKFDLPGSVKENVVSQSREDVAWLNETFGLDLYRDVEYFVPESEGREKSVEALSDPSIDSIAEVLGELVTEVMFRRSLEGGRMAQAQGNLDRAAGMFKRAERLAPDAQQPKNLLKAVAKQAANMEKSDPQRSTN